jgi:hypothetical protein
VFKRFCIGLVATFLVLATLHFGIRSVFGRNRPDLAAWVSFDDGLWAYKHTFRDGVVGPFRIGQSRDEAGMRLQSLNLLDEDRGQVAKSSGDWRVAIPAESGGYSVYMVHFDAEHVASVTAYYYVLADL